MKYEVDTDTHNGVGPYQDLYGHEMTVTIQMHDPEEEGKDRFEGAIFACLECGYTAHDTRLFMHEDCDRDDNPINTTFDELE